MQEFLTQKKRTYLEDIILIKKKVRKKNFKEKYCKRKNFLKEYEGKNKKDNKQRKR